VLRRGRSGCRPRRRAPRAGRALSDFGEASTVSVLRDVVKDGQGRTRSLERPRRQCGGARFKSTPISARSTDGLSVAGICGSNSHPASRGRITRSGLGWAVLRRLPAKSTAPRHLPRPGTAGVSPLHHRRRVGPQRRPLRPGGTDCPGEPHHYRLQDPGLLIEWDNTQSRCARPPPRGAPCLMIIRTASVHWIA